MGLTNSSGRSILRRARGTMNTDSSGDESTSSEPDHLVSILQYLIHNNGRVRLLTSDESELVWDDTTDMDDNETDGTSAQSLSDDTERSTNRIDKSEIKQDVLLSSGRIHASSAHKPNSLREHGMHHLQQFTHGDKCLVSARFLPNKRSIISQHHDKVFCGTYSQDGNLLLTACQDSNIRLYHTTGRHFNLFKTIKARDVGWSILDTAFSPDGNFLVYSSWSECFHLCNIYGDHDKHEALPLCPDDRRFCIFSLAFSQDGCEILGGANDCFLYIYDIENKQRTLKIDSHANDVNTVAFADPSSHIIFSGGDDGLCKVWDRRALNENNPQPVGILAGHRNGITFVDPKGDGRHLITNCKDQTIKLWDMRLFSPPTGIDNTLRAVNSMQWDYRWQKVPKQHFATTKLLHGDTSLMTYTGHSVLKTLIRCRFSPSHSTGQRYIYTGCASGRVIIYDVLTGDVVQYLEKHRSCVRDVSWHPYRPDIVSTSWDGNVSLCTYEEEGCNSDSEDCVEQEPVDTVNRSHTASHRHYNLRERPTREQR